MHIKDVGNKLTKLAGVIFVVSIIASVGACFLVKTITGELIFGILASVGFLILYMPLFLSIVHIHFNFSSSFTLLNK